MIKRSVGIRWVGGCLAFLWVIAGGRAAERPNILVILVDDAGYEDFGFMGSDDLPTPNIDRLAAQGTILDDAHVTATVCSPSRAGLITGRYQQRFGHENNVPPDDQGMDPEETTLGDALGAVGYRTIAVGKWHLGNRTMFHPNNRGFDEFYGFLEGGRSYFKSEAVDTPGNYRALLHNREQIDFEGYLTDVFTDKAIDYIEESKDRPWFIYLSYNAVHTPMHAKEEHLKKFAGHPRRELAAMTWSLDENVGKLVGALEASGQLKNTLIFFLSDNGGATNNQSSNAPLKGWKGNKFEGGHRVPYFLVWNDRIPAGNRYDGLSSSLDVFATSIAAAGMKSTTGKPLDGVNLLPYLRGEAEGAPHEMLFWRKDEMAAMRSASLKLIRLEGYGYRLYDLDSDLGETRDLSLELPGERDAMAARLIEWDRAMSLPWWYEDAGWPAVTYEIHRALMDNETPRYRNPGEMESWKRGQSN